MSTCPRSHLIVLIVLLFVACVSSTHEQAEPGYSLLVQLTWVSGGVAPVVTGTAIYSNRWMRYAWGGEPHWRRLSETEFSAVSRLLESEAFRAAFADDQLQYHRAMCCDMPEVFVSLRRTGSSIDALVPDYSHWFDLTMHAPPELAGLLRLVNTIGRRQLGGLYVPIDFDDDPA